MRDIVMVRRACRRPRSTAFRKKTPPWAADWLATVCRVDVDRFVQNARLAFQRGQR